MRSIQVVAFVTPTDVFKRFVADPVGHCHEAHHGGIVEVGRGLNTAQICQR